MSYFTGLERPNPNNFKIHNMIYANVYFGGGIIICFYETVNYPTYLDIVI